jgi:hypothetical protein
MLRLACLLAIAAQLLLIVLFLRPTGRSAIGFAFVGNPLLAVAVLLGLLWWFRNHREKSDAIDATTPRDVARGSGPGDRPGAGG